MTKTNMCRLTFISLSVGLLLCSVTAEARRFSITRAARTAWERHISNDSVQKRFPFQGRNGSMDARIITGRPGDRSRVVVESLTPSGRHRTTTFSVVRGGTPSRPQSDLQKISSVLGPRPARRVRTLHRSSGSSSRQRYHNPDLEAARGYAPGTVGHARAVGRAGFHPDSIGLELQAGYRRGSIGYNQYWSSRGQGQSRRGW
jgi:hypothetical protein